MKMTIGASLLLDTWEVISDHLPNNKRDEMARKLVSIFAEHGLDRDDFMDIKGEDENLDAAIDALYTGESEDSDYEYDEDFDD